MKTVFFRIALAFLFCCGFALAAQAQDKPLQIGLAQERINITTGFDGAQVVVFGVTDTQDAEIAVTLRGPERRILVRRKDQAVGAWMNRESVDFRRVPDYYDYSSTLPGQALLERTGAAKAHQLGVNNLDFYPENADEDPQTAAVFRDALIRRMQEKGFYALKAGTVQRLSPGFFKAVFDLPPGVPTGVYTAEAIVLKGDRVEAREAKNFQIGQVGFNAQVYLFAQNNAFAYAVFCVIFAFTAGWAAFTFLRRD